MHAYWEFDSKAYDARQIALDALPSAERSTRETARNTGQSTHQPGLEGWSRGNIYDVEVTAETGNWELLNLMDHRAW